MRGAAVLLSLAFLLAGCSGDDGGDDGSDGPGAASSATVTSTAPPPPPVPRTDTLHFLEGPLMTTVPPTGSDIRTPVGFSGEGPGGMQGPTARWAYQVTSPTNVTSGDVRVWVDVKEQMVPSPSDPTQPACTWRLTTNIGADTEDIIACINEAAGPIPIGVKELAFTLVLDGSIELEEGETVTVTLTRNAFSLSANNAVDALSGSPEHDSRIQMGGLREPIGA